MINRRKFGVLFVTLFCFLRINAQTDTCQLRISLLTCSAGQELYSAWGHTAIRVTDQLNNTDNVYNYGTFDDQDPLFLANFTKGLMLYSLSSYPFSEFVREYQFYQRGVIEQELVLTCTDKLRLYAALRGNDTEASRHYNYYFHTDNCTSRARDMIVKNIGSKVDFKTPRSYPKTTYRKLIHIYLDSADMVWSKFGIDILLGGNLDREVSYYNSMFLPDYLMAALDSSTINNQPLVSNKRVILDEPQTNRSKTVFTPLLVFSLLALLIIVLSFFKTNAARRTLNIFDTVFFLFLGIIGVLLVVLWIIRIDDVCRNNFNLLWALPTHMAIAFVLLSKKTWVKKYFRFVLFLTAAVAAGWFIIPQQLSTAVAPILAIILVRSWKRAN